jgi:DNA mismatch repair protein MutS
MMEQYAHLKAKAGDALLFFRMGDFYELFHDDAIVAARALNITLTSRQKYQDEPIPMCGVPYHSAEGYLDRLLQQGLKVAIAEQIEDPRHADGLVKRDIIRVVTPGTVVSTNSLAPKAHNFLACIAVTVDGAGFAFVDVSTGTFAVTTWTSEDAWQQALRSEYERVQPREVLIPKPLAVPVDILERPSDHFPNTLQPWDAQHFRVDRAYRRLTQHFSVRSLEGFGCEEQPLAIAAAGALLTYVHETQQNNVVHVQGLTYYSTGNYMVLDHTTRQNLDLFPSSAPQGDGGSLLEVIDATVTAMGGRLLREWLSQPLCRLEPLQERQDAVADIVEQPNMRARLRDTLGAIADLERLMGRLSLGTVTPRELVALRRSIEGLPGVEKALQDANSTLLDGFASRWDSLADLAVLIKDAIIDDPPATLRDGWVLRSDYCQELGMLREESTSGKNWLSQFEAEERKRTGIPSLRVGFNKVFGYYIEVRKTYLEQVPAYYVRKQTLVNAERFIVPVLKDREVQMLRAAEEAISLEHQLYDALVKQLVNNAGRLQQMAQIVSQIDVIAALAHTATVRRYCRPTLDMTDELAISEGRHPVLEVVYREERFVPNDTLLNRDDQQILLLTGPNMAGKSTYMRQVALTVVLAQTGSYVPAREARVGLVDRIFTRVGAQDLLSKGRSTFMVEMTETANILHNLTARSLILLDEIGRGTSTYDGMSIAWAVIEHIHNHRDLRPRALFATHYHELTNLAAGLPRLYNFNAVVQEEGERIVFLRHIVPGSANRSYGIQVARLAGLPASVVYRARQLLAHLESRSTANESVGDDTNRQSGAFPTQQSQRQPSLFDDLSTRLLDELRATDLDEVSPLEALNKLAEYQDRARRLP